MSQFRGSGLLVICKFFGILQKTTEASAAKAPRCIAGAKGSRKGCSLHRGSKDFRRGTAAKASDIEVAYRIVESTVLAEEFIQQCQGQSDKWLVALKQENSTLFLQTLHAITDDVVASCHGDLDNDAERAHARGCCVRALIFVGVTAGSLKNFGETSAKLCSSFVPEQPELFEVIAADSKWSMADMGHLFFGRPSWGMFLPVFVLMWHKEVKERRDRVENILQLAASDQFAAGAHALARSLGHNAPAGSAIAYV